MTRNREISQLGKYILVDDSADEINFVGGTVNASTFIGDGSGLSAITATGTGVEIRDDGSLVGVAATINFGDNLTISPISAGIVTVTGAAGGGAVPSRTTVSGSTAGSIAPGASANITIVGYKSYALLKAEISSPAWVTLYCDTSSRTADSSRLITEDPAAGSGVIAEVITTTTPQTVLFTPTTIGFNNDGTLSSNIYAKVVNRSGVNATITVSLTIVQLES